jgi:hypothetical protein
MPIDIDTPQSPGWWLNRLQRKLTAAVPRLTELQARLDGDAPLPESNDTTKLAYRRFRAMARTNYAELIIEAPRERMLPLGFRTAADNTDAGDAEARRVWDENDLDVEWPSVAENMLGLGDGYMMIGDDDDNDLDVPTITSESPFQCTTIHDPVQQRRVRAGLKMFHDEESDEDLAFVMLRADPGNGRSTAELWVAHRSTRRNTGTVTFTARTWEWDMERTAALPGVRPPIVRFRNKKGIGEFEHHVDLLDRLDHQVYQRMVIATMQAFRQRAVKGLPFFDENGDALKDASGQPITLAYYEELFVADPGAFWSLPETAEMWESGQVDLTPLSTIDKDDLAKLSAVTRTPLPTLMPGDGADSAEGASFKREGLVFKVQDRIARATAGLKDVMSIAFEIAGDEQRAERSGIEVLWMPPERRSLAERASASAQAGTDLPWRTKMTEVWQFTPQQIDRMEAERAADALLVPEPPAPPAPIAAAPAAPPAPAPAPAPTPDAV